jgi:parallel beta-helix repeat protein
MAAIGERVTHLLLALVLLALLAIIGMLATGVRGGPLDPGGPPAGTSSVRLPGTPVDPPANPAAYPIQISAPGHYYLTGPLDPPASTTAIRISASDVSLDLGGFTVTGSGTGSIAGILVFGAQARVEISHGTVRGFPGAGVSALGATHAVIDRITVVETNSGIQAGSYSTIRDCESSANADSGILVSGSYTTIERCRVSSNAFIGISIQNGTGVVVRDSSITGNNTSGVATGGIGLNSMDGATIRDNDFDDNLQRDVQLNFTSDDNVLINNTLTCPAGAIQDEGADNVYTIDTTDPGTNHTHGC